jgi:tagatose 6-phosphate kinase
MAMAMTILCATPNVALDRTLTVPGFTVGGVWRAASVHVAAGGKGLNCGRALQRLGQSVQCAGLLGGGVGALVERLARDERLPCRWTWFNGETRVCVIIDRGDGGSTVINEPGPPIPLQRWRAFETEVASLARSSALVCISGSLPPTVPPGAMRGLIAAARGNAGPPVWVDSSGEALREATDVLPWGVKINSEEAAMLVGAPVVSRQDAVAAAAAVRKKGVPCVVITLAERGAVLMNAEGTWASTPPAVLCINSVGSGDCFLAGLAAGFLAGEAPPAALALATATAAANAATAANAVFDPADVAVLRRATKVEPLA